MGRRHFWMALANRYLFGVVLGILLVLTFAVLNRMDVSDEEQLPWVILYALLTLYPAMVGFLAGRGSRSIGAGARAGAITALIGWGIALLSLIGTRTAGLPIEAAGLMLFALIGAACGAIGALIGIRLQRTES